MGSQHFILAYVQECSSGKIMLSECGPAWQIGIIAVLLVSAIAALLVLRIRAYTQSEQS